MLLKPVVAIGADGKGDAVAVGAGRPLLVRSMPYKFNESRRHKIPKAKYRVTNWPEYDAALIKRGSLTVWMTEEAIAAWQAPATRKRGGQPIYSAIAIETSLALRLVFHQPLRQTEGLLRSIAQDRHRLLCGRLDGANPLVRINQRSASAMMSSDRHRPFPDRNRPKLADHPGSAKSGQHAGRRARSTPSRSRS